MIIKTVLEDINKIVNSTLFLSEGKKDSFNQIEALLGKLEVSPHIAEQYRKMVDEIYDNFKRGDIVQFFLNKLKNMVLTS